MGTISSSQSLHKLCVTVCVTVPFGNFQSQYASQNVHLLPNHGLYLLLPFKVSENILNRDLNYAAKLEEHLILVCKIIQKIIAVEGFPSLKDGMQLHHKNQFMSQKERGSER